MTIMTNVKIEVKKFIGRNNFELWKCEVLDDLYEQDLHIALEKKKPEKMEDKDWEGINHRACEQFTCIFVENKNIC